MHYTRSANQFGQSLSRNRNHFHSHPGNRPVTKKRRGETIDVSRFVKKASEETAFETTAIRHSFADFAFVPAINTNLIKRNFTTPTPIQDQAIEPILSGRNLVGMANTGTGKTAAFLLPLINKVYNNPSERVLIIAPTRELAQQIEAEFRQFSWNMKIFSVACVGGLPIYKQIGILHRNPGFVIGTPGRLKDLLERGAINFQSFNTAVLDEVDRMLDMGFIEDIRFILGRLPENRQSLFFSATMPARIRDLITSFCADPVTVQVQTGETTDRVEQNIVRYAGEDHKVNQLQALLLQPELHKVLIFCETKRGVKKLTESLTLKGFRTESIHGDKNQGQRQRALNAFRKSEVDILIATDVAARGLDIDNISHVINYTIPQTYNDYVHRIGRTGRGSKKGVALTFVN